MLKNHLNQPVTEITVYGASWCGDCLRAKAYLDAHKVKYINFDIDESAALADFVMNINGGNRSIPTILFPNGSILVEPSNQELAEKLGK